jgi:hypothetical protein
MSGKGDTSCEQFLDPRDDFFCGRRLLNDPRVFGLLIGGLQDEGYTFRLKLSPQDKALAVEHSRCKVGNVGQVGISLLIHYDFGALCLECVGKGASNQPHPLNDRDGAALKRLTLHDYRTSWRRGCALGTPIQTIGGQSRSWARAEQ